MNNRKQEIAISLLKMIEIDFKMRQRLAELGELYEGYHPKMESTHNHHADELEKIIFEIGWPTADQVGEEASYAAWLILYHAISKPTLIRKCLPLLQELQIQNKISPKLVAVLYDRICFFEMRPQKYGTQFDFDEKNTLTPWKIEDVKNVNLLRREIGLPPLEGAIQIMQKQAIDETISSSYINRLKKRVKWAKTVGWIE